jgi:DMSO/TMAO reductase YedYZ heme-binding membrane subunit
MINPQYPLASWFVLLNGILFLVLYGVPMSLSPLAWARMFQWEQPTGRPDLALYFGRCLGLLAVALILVSFHAVPDPRGNRWYFELLGLFGAFMVVLHIFGYIRRIQPWTETAEIALWAGACAGSIWIRFQLA